MQTSINNKNDLYQFLQDNDNPVLKRKYNKMKKILKKVIFASNVKFYEHQFKQCQNNSKKIWGLINEITCQKNRDNNTIQTLKTANGHTNTLNEYFTNIGLNVSNCLPTAPIPHQ